MAYNEGTRVPTKWEVATGFDGNELLVFNELLALITAAGIVLQPAPGAYRGFSSYSKSEDEVRQVILFRQAVARMILTIGLLSYSRSAPLGKVLKHHSSVAYLLLILADL